MAIRKGAGVILGFSMALISCSSFNSQESRKKELQVQVNYVRTTVENPILKYRKINRAKVLMYNSTLIVSNSHDGIAAYDASSGNRLWQYFVAHGVEKEPLLFRDQLYFGGNDGNFYSISAKNGAENWKVSIKSEVVSSPSFDAKEGRVYFLTSSNSLFALEAENGKQVWSYTRQDPSSYSIRGGTTPMIDGNLLYVGFSEGSFVAFNKSNGTINWEIQLNKNKRFKDIDSTAVVDKDRIYVSGYDDRLYCLSSTKGDVLWKTDLGGYAPVTIKDDVLFYPTTSGKVVALNKNSGIKLWQFELANGVSSEISLYRDMIVFGESQGRVLFLDAKTGKLLTSFEPGRGVLAPIATDEKRSEVYFVSGESNLYSLGVSWKFKNLFSYVD